MKKIFQYAKASSGYGARIWVPKKLIVDGFPFSHFLNSVCAWGRADAEADNCISYEIPELIQDQVVYILENRFGLTQVTDILG